MARFLGAIILALSLLNAALPSAIASASDACASIEIAQDHPCQHHADAADSHENDKGCQGNDCHCPMRSHGCCHASVAQFAGKKPQWTLPSLSSALFPSSSASALASVVLAGPFQPPRA